MWVLYGLEGLAPGAGFALWAAIPAPCCRINDLKVLIASARSEVNCVVLRGHE